MGMDDHVIDFHTGVSEDVVERGFGPRPPVHEQYSHKTDEGESFGLKWKMSINRYQGLNWAKCELVIMETSVHADPITTIKYDDIENVPPIALEKAADYFISIAEKL